MVEVKEEWPECDSHFLKKKDHSGHVWRLGEKKARMRMHTSMEMAALV